MVVLRASLLPEAQNKVIPSALKAGMPVFSRFSVLRCDLLLYYCCNTPPPALKNGKKCYNGTAFF